jgi:hypothetical protein
VPTARTFVPTVTEAARVAATLDPQIIADTRVAATAARSTTPIGVSDRCIACGIDHAAASALTAEREARERLFVAEEAIAEAEQTIDRARADHAEALKAAIAETEALIAPARSAAKRKRA